MILFLGWCALLPAQDAKSAFDAAVATYQAGKFGEAHDQFTNLNRQYGPQPAYLFNAGNAAHSAGLLPVAVLHYQEALELDPNFAGAGKNLALVEAEAQAMPGSLEKGILLPRVPLNALVLSAAIFLWLGLICATLVFAKVLRKQAGRGLPAVFTALFLMAAAGLGSVSAGKWQQHQHQQIGVVFKLAAAYADISEAGAKLADLKPATSVLVKSRRGNYAYALLPNGQSGWIPADALQMVSRRETMMALK